MTVLAPVEQLNSLRRREFADALRPLFEAAPPLADALYDCRPFTSHEQLIATAESLAKAMPFARQVEVLAAHPRIGASPESLSVASRQEQSHGPPPADSAIAQLAELNQQYEERFGFRFVVFVNRRPRTEIIDVLRDRLTHSSHEELQTGLHDMFLIARDRLASST